MVKIFNQYNRPDAKPTPVVGKSLTKQEYLKESLTSTIMERFAKTGVLVPPGMPRRPAIFADLTEMPDNFVDAFNLASRVQDAFSSLPSAIRGRFDNNPLALHAFLLDPANRNEAISLGLIEKPKEAPPPPKEATPPPIASVPTNNAVKDGEIAR